jgi:general secretion pathway protein G
VPQRLARLRAARQNEGGFTLIELLIVIVILGVLAGVVVFSVRFINDRGEKSACKTDIKTVQVAAEAYYAKNNHYPQAADSAANLAALKADGELQDVPTSDKYDITYTNGADNTKAPTITGALDGGGSCLA